MAAQAESGTRQVAGLLRFITCGSVDDGKSTLIGRLLYDCGALKDDQMLALRRDSARMGTQGAALDYALLLDGLEDERSQGITIDVAYRYFATPARRFIVADCPGHVQYTRNMATGASTADLAVVLVDARKGLLPQTRRHSLIVSLFGVRQLILAVNKMDCVAHAQEVFDDIAGAYAQLAQRLGIASVQAVPLSALHGDNVVEPSLRMPWYQGPSLLQLLESAQGKDAQLNSAAMILPVQWVNRPHQDFRGYCGNLASGRLACGDSVRIFPGGQQAQVRQILSARGEAMAAQAGEAVTVLLDRECDVARGDVLAAGEGVAVEVADQFAAHLLWMHEDALMPGRSYQLQLGTASTLARVTALKHRLDSETLEPLAARQLELNEIGICNLQLDRALAFTAFADNRELGAFILIDRFTNATVAAGVIDHPLRRASNLHRQALQVSRAARSQIKGHAPRCIWFTGLSGAGKSTIADQVEVQLNARGIHTILLDGDNIRHGLNRDLGFTDADRVENIRRVAEVAKLMVDAGLVVLVSFISPFRADRQMARELFAPGEFLEVYVDVPLVIAEARDVKGLYAKARAGQLPNFTGIDSPYEAPESPELRIATDRLSPSEAAQVVLDLLANIEADSPSDAGSLR